MSTTVAADEVSVTVVAVDEVSADVLSLLVKLEATEDAALFKAEIFTLTDTEALAAELEEDEDSSEVELDEYV